MLDSRLLTLSIRNFAASEIPAIIGLQRITFPRMAKDGEIWEEEELSNFLEVFPEGQFCASYGEMLVGSASSLIVKLEPEYRSHTWEEICYWNIFRSHDPQGDTLYDADISTHPGFRRLGIATKLYEVRKTLAQKLNLRRVVSGGRLSNYHMYSKQMNPIDYVKKVVAGEINEPVLKCQLKNGFRFVKILPKYLADAESFDYAAFLEWKNPSFDHNKPIGHKR